MFLPIFQTQDQGKCIFFEKCNLCSATQTTRNTQIDPSFLPIDWTLRHSNNTSMKEIEQLTAEILKGGENL